MLLIKSPEDLDYNFAPDGEHQEPSPNTAALLAPACDLTPTNISLTQDGKPQIMDLNNLGLHKGASLQTQHDLRNKIAGQNDRPHDKPRNDRVIAIQAESKAPLQAQMWKHEQRQRVEAAVNRLHQTYVNDARDSHLQPRPDSGAPDHNLTTIGGAPAATARPIEPVPQHTPQGWDQDKAARARHATDRIQQEYVDELREDVHFIEQMRRRAKFQEALDEAKRQRDRQRIRQEMFRPVSRTDDHPARTRAEPESCDSHSSVQPDPCDIPSWEQASICDAHARVQASHTPLTEAELDEKRRQLLGQKKTKEPKDGKSKKKIKGGKRGSKKKNKDNAEYDAGSQIIPEPPKQDIGNKNDLNLPKHAPLGEIVPRPPRQDAGDEFVPRPPTCRKDSGDELIPHPPRNDARSQSVRHHPAPPAKDQENDSSYSKRKRRLIAKGQDQQSSNGPRYAPSIAGIHGHSPSHRYYGPRSMEAQVAGTAVGSSASQPRLIPRQTSQQTMCWNSETAKRGLGFKSRQTQEAEQEARSKNAEATKLSADARNKWKKATFF